MLTAWNAFPMLDRLFDDVMSGVTGTTLGTAQGSRAFSPAIDVRTNDEQLVFLCDVPGVNESDIEITHKDRVLTIKGARRYEGAENEQVWLGRAYGSFERSFTLPDAVDPEQLAASLADGVLTIRVPKRPQARPRKIPIGVSVTGKNQLESKTEK